MIFPTREILQRLKRNADFAYYRCTNDRCLLVGCVLRSRDKAGVRIDAFVLNLMANK